jgi:hypothetical protein
MRITRSGNSLFLSWPAWASDISLQSREDLGQSKNWVPIGFAPVVLGEDAVVAFPVSAGRQFYRLSPGKNVAPIEGALIYKLRGWI